MFLHIRKNIYNTISDGLRKLVRFFATIIMCSFSLPPSSFHDTLSVSYFSLLSVQSGITQVPLPSGFQVDSANGRYRQEPGGWEEMKMCLSPYACAHAAFLSWHWCDSDCVLLWPFFPAFSFLLALGMSCSLASSDLG